MDGWKWTTESLEGVSGLKNVEERVLCRRTQRLNWKRGEGSPRGGPALTEPPMSQAAKAGGGPPGRRGDQGPQRLGIGSPAVADLHRDRLVKQLEQPEAPRGSGQDGGPAKGGEIEVCEIQVDLRRADFTLLQYSPAGDSTIAPVFSHNPLCHRHFRLQPSTAYQGIKVSRMAYPTARIAHASTVENSR